MIWSQVALIVVEAAVMAGLILGLFRARSVLGLSPLYIVMGGFQYLEATLSLRVKVSDAFFIYPGSSVMFTANLFAVLLVYLKEDAVEARKLVYGLVLANAGLMLVSLLVSAHFVLPGGVDESSAIGAAEFIRNAKIVMVGATLLFFDVLGIIIVYEFVSRVIPWYFLRLLAALVVVVAFDSLLFGGFIHFGEPDLWDSIADGFVAKSAAAAFYSLALWAYLRSVEPRGLKATEPDLADIFHMLTYRQRYEQVRERMIHDALTGLYNRGYFDEIAPRTLAHATRSGETLSLVIIDVDNFKHINDRFSHLEGDRVLRLVGATLGEQVRTADTVFRYGGDEFVILLPRTDVDEARAFAERFRARLRERCESLTPPPIWGAVTITAGIATYPTSDDTGTIDALMRVADQRLYEGKRAGRDRVVWGGAPAATLSLEGSSPKSQAGA
jgi:diguanylate cyclase (GGDEF)-like protein